MVLPLVFVGCSLSGKRIYTCAKAQSLKSKNTCDFFILNGRKSSVIGESLSKRIIKRKKKAKSEKSDDAKSRGYSRKAKLAGPPGRLFIRLTGHRMGLFVIGRGDGVA